MTMEAAVVDHHANASKLVAIERTISRRIVSAACATAPQALRCEKTARNYGSFVALALGLILIKSVHTA
jgi:hypothetical protein